MLDLLYHLARGQPPCGRDPAIVCAGVEPELCGLAPDRPGQLDDDIHQQPQLPLENLAIDLRSLGHPVDNPRRPFGYQLIAARRHRAADGIERITRRADGQPHRIGTAGVKE